MYNSSCPQKQNLITTLTLTDTTSLTFVTGLGFNNSCAILLEPTRKIKWVVELLERCLKNHYGLHFLRSGSSVDKTGPLMFNIDYTELNSELNFFLQL